MSGLRKILFCWFCLLCSIFSVRGQVSFSPILNEPLTGDSIIRHVIENADWYAHIVGSYHADLYVRGHLKVYRRNALLRVVPSMFHFEKGVSEYIVESKNDLHYSAPDIYKVKVQTLTGTCGKNDGDLGNIMEYFNMNVYSTDLLPDKIVSPFSKAGKEYYYYMLDSILDVDRSPIEYKVLIVPRYKSNQLVRGYVTVRDGSWTLSECSLEGKIEQVKFSMNIRLGDSGEAMYLPQRISVDMMFGFIGNKIGANYTAIYKYKDVKLSGSEPSTLPQRRHHDLTEYYHFGLEGDTVNKSLASMDTLRAFPLTDMEKKLYKEYGERVQSREADKDSLAKDKSRVFWGEVGDVLISNSTFRFNNLASLRCYPLLNPLQFRYSHSNGFSYIQRFKYNQVFADGKSLTISPRIGYNFTYKEFYWRGNAEFVYKPRRMGRLLLDVGNGNRIYSSEVLDRLTQYPDSIPNFDKLKLDYFKDLYLQLGNEIEIVNGLLLRVGVSFHKRTLVNKSNIYNPNIQKFLSGKMRDTYSSFAPGFRLTWTPGQYYYMQGSRKVYLFSKYPTFSLDWERAIEGVLGATGKYERMEVDMQQKFRFGGIRSFSYRFGGGAFTNQKEMYFVDFVNLRKNNLPDDWNDDIGGTFQLLDSRWYNWSNKYVRGHVVYETPFLLFRQLRKYFDLIQTERLYGGILVVPRLVPYVELGYGIGTHIFDFGVFSSFMRYKFHSFGVKFTFELFH